MTQTLYAWARENSSLKRNWIVEQFSRRLSLLLIAFCLLPSALSHFKIFDRIQLPACAHARQDVNSGARMLHAQLIRVKSYVQVQVICVELLAAQHVRLPALGLRAHRATHKLYQLARHNQRPDLRLTAS